MLLRLRGCFWEERVGARVVRVADRVAQLSERCVARAAGRGACYISRLERQGWGRRCCAGDRAAYRAVSLHL